MQRLRVDRFRIGTLPFEDVKKLMRDVEGTIECDGMPAKLRVVTAHGQLRMHVAVDGPPPASTSDRIGFNLSFGVSDFALSLVGVLHSAYLRMVYLLGYEYALNPNIAELRRSLAGLAAGRSKPGDAGRVFAPFLRLITGQLLPIAWHRLHAIKSPPGRRCFMAIVRTLPGQCAVVPLPGFGNEGRRAYDKLISGKFRGPFDIGAVEVDGVSFTERLRDPALAHHGRDMWLQTGDSRSTLRKAMARKQRGRE